MQHNLVLDAIIRGYIRGHQQRKGVSEMTNTFNIGDRVMARIFGSEYYPATIVNPVGWYFIPSMCYPVEFDRKPVTASGTLNSRRVTVLKCDVKAVQA